MRSRIEELKQLVFSYFNVDISTLKSWLTAFSTEERVRDKYLVEENVLDFQAVRLGAPCSGGGEKMTALVFSPQAAPNHCVFVSNSADGWYTLINRMASQLQATCIRVATSLDAVDRPANSFRVYVAGRDIRYVRAMLDSDRWDFFEKGVVQPFEEISSYKKRRIKDRLTRQIVVDYLLKLDIDIRSDAFWGSDQPAVYIYERRPVSVHNT